MAPPPAQQPTGPGESQEPGQGRAASAPKPDATAEPKLEQKGDPNEALIAELREKRTNREPLILIPGPAIDPLAKALERASIQFDLRGKRYVESYYVNHILLQLRHSGSLWLVLDSGEQKVVDVIQRFVVDDNRLELRQEFGPLLLLKLASGPAENQLQDRLVRLEAVHRVPGVVTDIQFDPTGESMLVAIKTGVVLAQPLGSEASGYPVLDIEAARSGSGRVFSGGESGLIGLVCHPDFQAAPRLYTQYIWERPDKTRVAVVSEWKLALADGRYSAEGERVLLEIPQPHMNHNAGQLVFGPDGFLYIAVGDGEEGEWLVGRSRRESIRGKVLRIDVDSRTDGKPYGIPADNPYVGDPTIPPETWAWGFRNPWRLTFVADGRLLAGDIGEDQNEELTFVVRGRHHGWPFVEGAVVRAPAGSSSSPLAQLRAEVLGDVAPQSPLVAYGRDAGMSVIAGREYLGSDIPGLQGQFVFADHLSGRIWATDLPASTTEGARDIGAVVELGRWPLLFTSFGMDPAKRLYVGTHTGQIYRLVPPGEGDAMAESNEPEMLDLGTIRAMLGTELPAPGSTPATKAQVQLGKRLFSDVRLSSTGALSCASCHDPKRSGQDGLRLSLGLDGAPTRRNTPSVFNAHRQVAQRWDFQLPTVEAVAMDMLTEQQGLGSEPAVTRVLNGIPELVAEFEAAYGPGSATGSNCGHALGAFLRELVTRSKWDEFLDGDDQALSREQLAGLNLFVTLGCSTCHQYRTLGGSMAQKLGLLRPWVSAKPDGSPPDEQEVAGYFKVPMLLNVASTAPYYHDGSLGTLAEATRNMAAIQLNRDLTDAQVNSIVKFLEALTGPVPEVVR